LEKADERERAGKENTTVGKNMSIYIENATWAKVDRRNRCV
jgi:hypothetical protein